MSTPIRVTVWNEFRHEREDPEVKKVYPEGIHAVIASHLNSQAGLEARTATLDEPQHGLTDEVLESTDVLLWWSHLAVDDVSDAVVDKVCQRVHSGMGFLPLHSAHISKPFLRLMGTSCLQRWRESGEKERIWNIEPSHPIAEGIGDYFELPKTEMYGERFDIPTPETLIFISWFQSGEVFRSGCTWQRGHGRIFFLRPGHETFPIYYDINIRRILTNAVRWTAPRIVSTPASRNVEPLERLS